MPMEDRQLVQRFVAGERAAFDALYRRHVLRVFRLLYRLTANEAEAEDLTQETFLAAYHDLPAWRGEGQLSSWLCGIAFHQYSRARRQARPETEPLEEEGEIAAPDADPLSHCLRQERQQQIETAIAALAPLYREVFVLIKVEGLSYREAAAWLGVPLGTVQWRLWRAVCLLQVALDDLSGVTGAPDGRPAGRAGSGKPPAEDACLAARRQAGGSGHE
jgi:RNA polymerase sigma-70 factor (ECF subfamily)